MEINRIAPVISRQEIVINAPVEIVWRTLTDVTGWTTWQPEIDHSELSGPLRVGAAFHWQTAGLAITSTIGEIIPLQRIAWDGPAQGIDGIHVWTLTPQGGGVLVSTEESWDGDPVRAQSEALQQTLDASLVRWLDRLKVRAEAQTQSLT
jgi:uncharacterized protein YndB with AHSA1/START domain